MTEDYQTLGRATILLLLSFAKDTKFVRGTGIPQDVAQETLQEFVRIFFASASISEALLSSAKGSTSTESTESSIAKKARKSSRSLGDSTAVYLDEDTLLLAAPVDGAAQRWIGLIVSPCVLHDTVVIDGLLHALGDAAEDVIHGADDCEEKLFSMWQSMLKNLHSAYWLTGERISVDTRRAIIELGERHAYQDLQDGSQYILMSAAAESLEPSFTVFRSSVENVSGYYEGRFCIVTPEKTVAYTDRMSRNEMASVLWFYRNFVDIGALSSKRQFFEVTGGESVRLWYRWRGWLLYVQVLTRKHASPEGYNGTRQAAVDMIRAFVKYKNENQS